MLLNRRALLGTLTSAGVLAALPVRAATANPTGAAAGAHLSPQAMHSDLDLLRHAYEAVHPGLDRYLGRQAWRESIDAAKRWANRERSLAEMFVMLGRLTALVRCGHSFPNGVNQTEAAQQALFSGRDRVPFAFRWIDGKMIVTGGRGGATPLDAGSEVLSVDGVPARRLLETLLPLARADGASDGKRLAQLGLDPRERFAGFDVYRAAMFPTRTGRVDLRARLRSGEVRTLDVPALTEQELGAARGPNDPSRTWRFEIDGQGIGRLTMPSWVTYHSNWDWQAFLNETMDRLVSEDARGLVIDLRGNEGGSDCGWPILERMIGAPVEVPKFVRRVRYRVLPADLSGPLDTWDDSFRDWTASTASVAENGLFRMDRGEADDDRLNPRGRRYAGPVAVLVDATCSSATFQFANAVKTLGVARLVGEVTGGNRRGLNGGAYFFLRLPATGLEVDTPVIGFFSERPQPDAGIVPDRLVRMTARDIAAGADPQMAAALAELRSA